MKNLKSTKSRVILSLALLIVLTGLMPTLGIFSGGKQPAHASTGWQLQELWHMPVTPPDPNASTWYANDLTYSSGKIYGGFTYLCPVGIDGQVCTTTTGFDAMTGATIWQKNFGAYYPAPLISNGKLYFPLGDPGLQVYDAANDQLPQLWSGLGSTAAINNGTIYTHMRSFYAQPTDGFYSYDAITGQTKWQQLDATCDYGPKVEVYNNIVYYIGCGTDYHNGPITWWIDARSTKDGSVVWSQTVDYPDGGGSTPVPGNNSTLISNGLIFLSATTTDGSNNPSIASYSTTDGTQKWKKTLSDTTPPTGTNLFIGQIIASGSTVYVLVDTEVPGGNFVTHPVDVYALDSTTGNEIWHHSNNLPQNFNNNFSRLPSETLVNGVLYVNYNSVIYAWDAATGNQLMMDDSVATSSNNNSVSTPLVVGNIMYITRENTAVSPNQYTLYAYDIIGQQPSPTPSPTPPPTEPSVSLSVDTTGTIGGLCTNTLSFSVNNAVADKLVVNRNGVNLFSLQGNATTYTDYVQPLGINFVLYEVSAFQNGKFLALARLFAPLTCSGTQPPPAPDPPITGSQDDLFIIVGGINSHLSAYKDDTAQANGDSGYGYDPGWMETDGYSPKLGAYLEWKGYLNSRFIFFSYNGFVAGTDGKPQAFTCANTYDNGSKTAFFSLEVKRLSDQIQAAVAGRDHIRLHILAHSQGGMLALAYSFALAKGLDGVPPLPAGVNLHDIDLLDSPVGGTPYNESRFAKWFMKYIQCNNPSSPKKFYDLIQMDQLMKKVPSWDTSELGENANIVAAFFGASWTDPNNINQKMAEFAHQHLGVTIFLAGNRDDYLWQPHGCNIFIANFPSTQNLIDEGDGSGIESRTFTSASDAPFCLASANPISGLNHSRVLSDPNVERAVLNVIQDKVPGLTPYTG